MDKDTEGINASSKSRILENILQRDAERRSRIQEKKDDGDSSSEVAYFRKTFKTKENELVQELESCGSLSRDELIKVLHNVRSEINTLHKYVSASIFLNQYDLKIATESLQKLEVMCKSWEVKHIPRKKFGFKSKLKKFDEQDTIDRGSKPVIKEFEVKRIGIGFWDRCNETLCLGSSTASNQDISIANIDSCTIIIRGSPNTVYLNSISNSTILMGPVKTSVLMYTCMNSVILAMCQQMRIHKTESTDFYIHVTTRAIIEDCKNVRFATYSYSYPELDEEVSLSGLNTTSNNWNLVDDFNWLSVSKPSPNWSIIPESERHTSWPYSDKSIDKNMHS